MFGDSYSTPGLCVEPEHSFWMTTARYLGARNVYNYSWPGNSLDSVIHTLISDSDQYDWQHDFFLIGIPPLVRLTVVSDDDKKSYHRYVYDSQGREIDQQLIASHHGLENKNFYDDPLAVRFEDATWTEIQACRLIFLVNAWLDKHRANYLIVNLSKDFQDDSPSTGAFLLDHCLHHPHNLLIKDTYYNLNLGVNKPADYAQYGWNGHHGASGNQYFFTQALMPRLTILNLC